MQASGQQFVVGTGDSGIVLRMWDGCDRLHGSLRLVSPEGEVLVTLIPPGEGVFGVLSAVMVG